MTEHPEGQGDPAGAPHVREPRHCVAAEQRELAGPDLADPGGNASRTGDAHSEARGADLATPTAVSRGWRQQLWHRYQSLSELWQTTILIAAVASVAAAPAAVTAAAEWISLMQEDDINVVVQMAPQPAPPPAEAGPQCSDVEAFDEDKNAPTASVYVRIIGGCWGQLFGYVAPGSELEYLVTYRNMADYQHDDVVLRAALPSGVRAVSGSAAWFNASHPDGVPVDSDDVWSDGINVGPYKPGANAYVTFRAVIPAADEVDCGVSDYQIEGFAHPWGGTESSNTAVLSAYRGC